MNLQSSSVECPQLSRSLLFDSQEISDRVSAALRRTGYPALRNIEPQVHEGLLTLKGRVGTFHLKQVAQSVAMTVEGVAGIENLIVVG